MSDARREAAQTFARFAARAGLGVWLGRVQDWTDENSAALTLARSGKRWTVTLVHGLRTVTADDPLLAVALARIAKDLFR